VRAAQVRLCLDKGDFIRAQILSRKISARAFVEKKGDAKGEIGIEGTAIEAPEEVSFS
jgi:26S proteasome regulatory subunit N5